MKSPAANLLCAPCIFLPVLACAQTVAKITFSEQGFPVVAVSINGSGPYPFLLDTGSNRTLIQNDLLAQLGIPSARLVPVDMANGISYLYQAIAQTVTVGSVSVHQLVIEGISSRQLGQLAGPCRGVLGEDFLDHFDLLIDNREKTLTLDESSTLAASTKGNHLPLSSSGMRNGHATVRRPSLDVKLSLQREVMHFLIDSGSNHAFFFPSSSSPPIYGAQLATLITLNGKSRCYVGFVTLRVGKDDIPNLGLASCEGITRDKFDVDGTLPTDLFDRLFISHSGKYAILNPHSTRR